MHMYRDAKLRQGGINMNKRLIALAMSGLMILGLGCGASEGEEMMY